MTASELGKRRLASAPLVHPCPAALAIRLYHQYLRGWSATLHYRLHLERRIAQCARMLFGWLWSNHPGPTPPNVTVNNME